MKNGNRKKFKWLYTGIRKIADRLRKYAQKHPGNIPLIIGIIIVFGGLLFGFGSVYGQQPPLGYPYKFLDSVLNAQRPDTFTTIISLSGKIVADGYRGDTTIGDSAYTTEGWVNDQGFVATEAGDLHISGHLAEIGVGFWLDIDHAWIEETPDNRVHLNTFLDDCDDDGAGACALHPYLLNLPAGGIWGYDEALFFTPIVCSTSCNVIEDLRFNVRRAEGAWHTPIDSFSTSADYDSLAGPIATKDSFDTDIGYIADVFSFIDENGTPWTGCMVQDQTGGDTTFIAVIKGNEDDITDWLCTKAASSDNQMYRFSEGDTVAAPDKQFYIVQLIPSNTQKYVSPQMAMLESGKYRLWVNSVREDNTEPPNYADTARLLIFESQYPCSAFTFIDTVEAAEDSSVFVFNDWDDSTGLWHFSLTPVAPNILLMSGFMMNWKDNATLPNPPRTDSTYDGGVRLGISYDGGSHFYFHDEDLINRNYDTDFLALHLYQAAQKYDYGTNTVDMYVSGKDSTANEYEWGIGRVRIRFRDTLLVTTPIDSSDIPNDMIPWSDIDWPFEWIELPTVIPQSTTTEDSSYLVFPKTANLVSVDRYFLLMDSAGDITPTHKDTFVVAGTVPHDCTIDSIKYFMYEVGSGKIDAIDLMGPDSSEFYNTTDSSYWSDETDKDGTAIVKYDNTDITAKAGDRFGIRFQVSFAADNDRTYIGWVQLGVQR